MEKYVEREKKPGIHWKWKQPVKLWIMIKIDVNVIIILPRSWKPAKWHRNNIFFLIICSNPFSSHLTSNLLKYLQNCVNTHRSTIFYIKKNFPVLFSCDNFRVTNVQTKTTFSFFHSTIFLKKTQINKNVSED